MTILWPFIELNAIKKFRGITSGREPTTVGVRCALYPYPSSFNQSLRILTIFCA